jgi:MFS family permease
VQITAYSVVTSMFSDELMKHIGYVEIAVGVGMGMGPVIGSLFFSFLDYEGTMYAFGIVCFFATFMCIYMIPSDFNDVLGDDELAEIEVEQEDMQKERSLLDNKIQKITILTILQ